MAIGRHMINVNLDTASDPDDTVVLGAQGVPGTAYLQWIRYVVTTAEASTRVDLEDGVGGNVLDTQVTTAVGTFEHRFAVAHGDRGLRLSENTILNATTIGGTALVVRVLGEIVVR